ncbi:DUF1173 domain-containing protein [Pseudothauera nasutitermitis]|uniref:DUF1173 domain-containing protein n=1 Tax=Pseudothauera nasutitermitis TaxID=2565930 RepID=A0A4S4B242_9RHOO|nr:DUF1173 family protein [Pseudothauera nasutitermitis]THF64968.1 DUF1173 domain-containing protein [Pseudothauera nasutitermitis]
MDGQRFAIGDRVIEADDPQLQDALAAIHDTPERPRCLCMPGGVEMYVALHRRFMVKRMPDSGSTHHPACPSYAPGIQLSGLGELMGEAVLEPEPGRVELRVDFPWTRRMGTGVPHGEPREQVEVAVPQRRMSLRALLHFLFERAGFNRWSPAMAGKRSQGVLRKYLLEAAEEIVVKGVPLAERLYVPEPFSESAKAEAARRRRDKLAVLRPKDGQAPLAIIIGEYKTNQAAAQGRRIWIRHMPDAPLLVAEQSWARIERVFAPLFEARDADAGSSVRLVMAALVRARREYTYEIDAASLMLTNEQWIPIEGVAELPLIGALIAQRRRFVKPLRYDAKSAAAFPNALLLDAGPIPVSLHVMSAFMAPRERALKEKAIAACKDGAWVWWPDQPMPPLQAAAAPR